MKSGLIFFFVLVLVPVVFAAEIEMPSEFNQGETLIAKVTGNFYESITENDVEFYRDHVRTSVILNVEKIDNAFYIYAQLQGKNPGNYSILIKDAKYFQSGSIVESDLTKNFSINENTADFSVEPGFVVADEDFSLEVTNIKDYEITINVNINNVEEEKGFFESFFSSDSSDSENSVSVFPGEKEKILFDIVDFNKQEINTVELSSENTSYEIIVYSLFEENGESLSISGNETNFRFEPSVLNVSMSTNSNTERIVYITNLGDEITNVSLDISDSLKPYLSLSKNKIERIEKNSSVRIDIGIVSGKEDGLVEGKISVFANNTYDYLVIRLNLIRDYVPINGEGEEIEAVIEKCSEINGVICSSGMKCSGDVKYASDGICCIGVCEEIQEGSSTNQIIGWTILIIIILAVLWFYLRKYKKVKSVPDFGKFVERR
ncbi:hypothetical protein J4407_02975 [Candidatus Pacearchaeota archaeon]|nr:hypothetical protein [Candidatus Pacearchaeota archaeon]